jgi:hypothetical protein
VHLRLKPGRRTRAPVAALLPLLARRQPEPTGLLVTGTYGVSSFQRTPPVSLDRLPPPAKMGFTQCDSSPASDDVDTRSWTGHAVGRDHRPRGESSQMAIPPSASPRSQISAQARYAKMVITMPGTRQVPGLYNHGAGIHDTFRPAEDRENVILRRGKRWAKSGNLVMNSSIDSNKLEVSEGGSLATRIYSPFQHWNASSSNFQAASGRAKPK